MSNPFLSILSSKNGRAAREVFFPPIIIDPALQLALFSHFSADWGWGGGQSLRQEDVLPVQNTPLVFVATGRSPDQAEQGAGKTDLPESAGPIHSQRKPFQVGALTSVRPTVYPLYLAP